MLSYNLHFPSAVPFSHATTVAQSFFFISLLIVILGWALQKPFQPQIKNYSTVLPSSSTPALPMQGLLFDP